MDLKDPLKMNIGHCTRSLLKKLGTDSEFGSHLHNITTTRELLDALSQLLVKPAFTLLVAREFRPILFDLCARWLFVDGHTDEILVALCLLLEPHPELFPYVPHIQRTSLLFTFTQGSEPIFEQDIRFQWSLELFRRSNTFHWPAKTPFSAVIILPHSPG